LICFQSCLLQDEGVIAQRLGSGVLQDPLRFPSDARRQG
jgi:hypothetical protein